MGLYLFWVHAEGSLGASYPKTNDPRRLSGLEESLNKQGISVEEVRKMAEGSRVEARRRVGENEGEGPIYRQKNRAWCKGQRKGAGLCKAGLWKTLDQSTCAC